jgi:hypothetical protein
MIMFKYLFFSFILSLHNEEIPNEEFYLQKNWLIAKGEWFIKNI